ncbi:hypothetical protein A3F66_05075 [candidate division TM6 bacterium RIFCSPHIGHO2_12_FULL_32_22]|nr:MAG: hypothetical protein A3F66_05075 [candidate division TM6 bacterium RIFCSPHIGHO2_12_FULL_32_22]
MLYKIKFNDLSKYFYFGVKWNAIEVSVYQLILIAHQTILFYWADSSIYGIIGTTFSFIYLSITILNFGLDKSLTPFYKYIVSSRSNFRRIFLVQLFIQLLIIILFSSLFFVIVKPLIISQLIILLTIIITESFKKSLKTLAQLSFLNNITALLEISSIILYTSLFWSIYFFTKKIDLFLALVPLLVESMLSLLLLGFVSYKIYSQITNIDTDTQFSWKEIIINRIYIFLTQTINLAFSTNLMLPIIAYQYGFMAVSTLHFIKHFITFLYLFLEKTFGITTGSIFTRISSGDKELQQKYSSAISLIYKIVLLILLTITVLFLFNLFSLDAYLFAMMVLIGTLFIPQEQLLLVKEKIYYLLIINLITASLYYCLLLNSSLKLSLITLLVIRLIFLFVINSIIKHKLSISISGSRAPGFANQLRQGCVGQEATPGRQARDDSETR